MQTTDILVLQCEQCDLPITVPRDQVSQLRTFLSRQGWERYGIHVSIAVAASDEDDGRYACGRCSRELTIERLDRLADQVLCEFEQSPHYDFIYPDGNATLRVYGHDWKIPLQIHAKDEKTRVALREEIRHRLANDRPCR
jgi:hypothetical protein